MVGRINAHHHAKLFRNWSIQSRHIAIFSNFQNGRRRHLGFLILKLLNFIGYLGGEGRDASARQISLKSVDRL